MPDEEVAQQEQPVAQMVPPMPLPEVWHVQSVTMSDGSPAVQVTVSSPAGLFAHFLPRTVARKIASDLRKTAEQGTGLVVPPAAGKLLVPGQ